MPDSVVVRADPCSRSSVARAIAAVLVARGWRYRRGSSAPWVPPGAGDDAAGYSLLGAAARQAELDEATPAFQRHADAVDERR